MGSWGFPAAIVSVVLLFGLVVFFAAKDQANWEDGCKADGGYVKKSSKTSTGYSSDGKMTPVTTTTTTYFCLSEDGRILDIR